MIYMNRQNLPLILFLLLMILLACKEETPEAFVPELKVQQTHFAFDSAGGEQVLMIESNTRWTIQHQSEWCKPSMTTDSGDYTLYIKADPNKSELERKAFLAITAAGVDSVWLQIVQSGRVVVIPEEPVDPEEPVEDPLMRNLSSLELSTMMGLGWNLGNSLEAITVNNGNFSGGETSWGNPIVTKQLIDSVKAAGFQSVRIPVSWSHKLTDHFSYQISEAWLERVAEVVDMVLHNEMYAIINIHWDGGWMNHPDQTHQAEINEKIEALWTQIATYFVDYSDHLLFAGTNEVHVENNYGAPGIINAQVQNSFNQTFLTAVRNTGGRNALRHLVVQGYNTNIDHTIKHFVLPDDPAEKRLMVEVHFYDPYDFALQESGAFKTLWGKPFAGGNVSSWGQENWVDDAFGRMKTQFVNQGIPVILGEYGAILRTSLSVGQEMHVEARNYYLEYVTRVAVENGMVPFYWDNGHTGNNGFGLFKRSNGQQVYPESIRAIMKANQ